MRGLATNGDRFDLDFHIFRQASHFHAGARREGRVMFGEERFISGIHGGEVVQIFNEYGRFNNVADFQACGFNDALTLSRD